MKTVFDDLIPIGKAPEKIPIAVKTLRNWRSQGLYPQIFVKIGGKVFVDLGEFEMIIQKEKKATRDQVRRLRL